MTSCVSCASPSQCLTSVYYPIRCSPEGCRGRVWRGEGKRKMGKWPCLKKKKTKNFCSTWIHKWEVLISDQEWETWGWGRARTSVDCVVLGWHVGYMFSAARVPSRTSFTSSPPAHALPPDWASSRMGVQRLHQVREVPPWDLCIGKSCVYDWNLFFPNYL